MNGMAADRHGHSERVKELVRQHWNRRAGDFDLEASHGLLTDAQAHAWRRLISDLAGAGPLDVLDIGCGTGFLSLLFAAARHSTTA
jgi:ubiquinone/menaquinone biosynthesis C-methylase UbiE